MSAAQAQTEAQPAVAQVDPPTVAFRWLASAEMQLEPNTTLSVGGVYLGGLQTAAPFVLLDRKLGAAWTAHLGYFHAIRSQRPAGDRTTQFARLVASYQVERGPVRVENRLLYEAVMDGQGREDGNRLRYRARLTVGIVPEAPSRPRLMAYVEPVIDDRTTRPSRIDLAAGAVVTVRRGWRLDAYVLRQEYLHQPRANLSSLVFELRMQVS